MSQLLTIAHVLAMLKSWFGSHTDAQLLPTHGEPSATAGSRQNAPAADTAQNGADESAPRGQPASLVVDGPEETGTDSGRGSDARAARTASVQLGQDTLDADLSVLLSFPSSRAIGYLERLCLDLKDQRAQVELRQRPIRAKRDEFTRRGLRLPVDLRRERDELIAEKEAIETKQHLLRDLKEAYADRTASNEDVGDS
ncbi:hypothetical protein JCM3774_001858 [Rhodotorula dairenensis]